MQFYSVLLLLCIHVQIFDVHTVIVIHACTTRGHIITHFWPMMTSVVMVLNLFLHLLQICILQVPRRQPRPGDSVMGRRVTFQCDVDIFTMVLHESNPVFPLILPRYLMAIIFTAFDLAAYNLKWLVINMHTHLHCQYTQLYSQ